MTKVFFFATIEPYVKITVRFIMANKFKYFGVMLDVSRNAVMKVETMKWYLPLLKKMGYNCLFLYAEDTYAVEGEPYFGYMRGRYTAEQMREMDEFASSIGMEVIPCIQTLAHVNTTLRWGKVPVDTADIMLVDDDRTYELIDHMFASLSKCFKTRKIHVGMDEAYLLGRGKHMDIHGYQPISEIMKRHLDKVCELAKKNGYEDVMLWSDMYIRAFNGGNYYLKDYAKVPKEVIDSVPENVIPVYWDYYHKEERIYDVNFDAHKQMSKNTWFGGGTWSWGGFMPHNEYGMVMMKEGIRAAIKNKVKNAFITMWGDDGAECSKVAMIPSLFAISEFAKGNEDMDLIKAKFKKLIGIEFDEFMLLDEPNNINGKSINSSGPVNPSKYMLFSDYFNGFLDITVVGGEKAKYEELAKQLYAVAKKTRKFGYLFNTAAKLCDALAVKFELGYKTREAYKAGDKDTLRALAENEYVEVEKLIKAYALTFEKQWFYENHPGGFDVQDIRLGAIIRRTSSCRRRILDYVNGKIDSIPELEEDLLPFLDREKVSVYCNQAKHYMTTNSLSFLT